MKIATIIVRTLLGLLFLFGSITYFLKTFTPPEQTGALKTFNDGLEASVYLLPLIKSVELVCGLAFISGLFVPLAGILISPIIVNIFFVHVFLSPEGLPVAIFLVLANSFLAYGNWDKYKSLFVMK